MKNPGRWLCEQIKSVLEAAPIDSDYTPGVSLPMAVGTIAPIELSRLPKWEPADREELCIALSDRARRTTLAGRSPRNRRITVQMLVVKRLDSEYSELEELIELMFAIDELIGQQTRLGYIESSNEPIYDPAVLDQHCEFKSILTMTFTNIT
jgi:hypothetical protein